MDEGAPIRQEGRSSGLPVFVSYATRDRVQALRVTEAIESRGISCWISTRDVAPGQNYQEAIVRALRAAPALVLVFSKAANDSDEIKKELSLASRFQIPVIALRLEEVDPSDAFAYELSTRQWIDAFESWPRALDLLVTRVADLSGRDHREPRATGAARARLSTAGSHRLIGAAILLLLVAAAGTWWWVRPAAEVPHAMMVRLAGFERLSTDLPATMPASVDAEIAAAFNADGVVGVSTASAPPTGNVPAYAVRGTIARNGDAIRVITNLVNERSGATLWSHTFSYDGKELGKVPRHVAVDAGNVVRCGLFGASTYHKPLPDSVLTDYMQFCQGHWDPNLQEGRKALVPAERVVAEEPDFSWGWAAVAGGYWKVALGADDERLAEQARASGRAAADKAIAIDEKNSEALYIKGVLTDRHDWIGKESLFKRAVAARRLDCGCEHHQYGWMLANVGRTTEALAQLRLANDMLALYVYTPLTLADVLVAAGKPEEAKTFYDAATSLAPDAGFADWIFVDSATAAGDAKALLKARAPISPALRDALVAGYRARDSGDARAKSQAAQMLRVLPADQQTSAVATLLAQLGATHDAFAAASRLAASEYPGPSIFWYRSMRATLSDPGFPALADQLGLMEYWKAAHVKPDVCSESDPPTFCRII